jgi:4-oxalocrotonate tautomerase
MDQIYEAMRETVHIKEGDRFQTITEHDQSEFGYGADFLDIRRTDNLVQIQIFWSPGKGAEMKQAMYKAIVSRLGKNPGVRPEDVFICVFEAPAENWSFGNGETQFYKP